MVSNLDYRNILLDILSDYENILIVGPLPPPIGGVSVHINRIKSFLNNLEIFDINNKYYNLFIKCRNKDVIHVHVFSVKIFLILFLLKKIKKFDLIYTEHREIFFNDIGFFKRFFYKIFLKKFDIVFVVNNNILSKYLKYNLNIPNKLIIEPAFLPPDQSDEKNIINTYPDSLIRFLQKNNNYILANAFQIEFYNNEDLYGLDMCVNLIYKLISDKINVSLIFAISNINYNNAYVTEIKNKIIELGIADNVYILHDNHQIWPLYKTARIFLRPTNTDGDALSIREALYYNCRCIASDVCFRPINTIIFKNRNINDLYNKVINELSTQSINNTNNI